MKLTECCNSLALSFLQKKKTWSDYFETLVSAPIFAKSINMEGGIFWKKVAKFRQKKTAINEEWRADFFVQNQ